ncbi:HTH domain-containing protein [Pararcticibacter amylolyticus]|uniref:Uncharacterized protein n=1 Tax=Pararcticibacter amylolyticus TaxID=2173175 RepID=A0A2U2P9S2_9SPHI|nr:HTH domain-containing protein [Pararcticibacter amylolyticus]PWG78044.1 hypothetical protein DDR33_24355 [Pararcticibacter amylolyticus]
MLTEMQDRLEVIDYLIKSKSTGTPKRFAERLDISERRLYELLNEMRELGAPISYNRYRSTYYYKEKGGFRLGFIKDR